MRQKEENRRIKEFYSAESKREQVTEEVMRFDIEKEEEGEAHLLPPESQQDLERIMENSREEEEVNRKGSGPISTTHQ